MKDTLIGTIVFALLMGGVYFAVNYFEEPVDSVNEPEKGFTYAFIEGQDAEIEPEVKDTIENALVERGTVEASGEQVDAALSLLEKVTDKLESQPKKKVETKPARMQSFSGDKPLRYYDIDNNSYVNSDVLSQKSEIFYFSNQTKIVYSVHVAAMSRLSDYEMYTKYGGEGLDSLGIDWEKEGVVLLKQSPVEIDFESLDNVSYYNSSGSYWSDGKNALYVSKNDNPVVYSLETLNDVSASQLKKLYAGWHAHYVTDGKLVIFNGERIVDADADSFNIIKNQSGSWTFGHYAKDKNNVYYYGERLEEPKPETFNLLEVVAKPQYQFSISFDTKAGGFFVGSCFLGEGGQADEYNYTTEVKDGGYVIEFDDGVNKTTLTSSECGRL